MEGAEDPNGDLRKLMYSLVERFDALQEDVEHLKGEKSASTVHMPVHLKAET